MDRRNFKPRRGLHQNFMGPSTSTGQSSVPEVPESEDMFSSSHRSVMGSQRQSSLELLRKRTQTPTSVDEDSSTSKDNTRSQKRPQTQAKESAGSPAKKPRQESNTAKLLRLTQDQEKSKNPIVKPQSSQRETTPSKLAKLTSQTREKSRGPTPQTSQLSTYSKLAKLTSQTREKSRGPTPQTSQLSSPSKRHLTPTKSLRLPQKTPEKFSSPKVPENRDPRSSRRPSPTESDKENKKSSSKPKPRTQRTVFSDSSDDESIIQTEKTLLDNFFDKCGIRPSVDNGEQYTISSNPAGVVKKIQQVLSSGSFTKATMIADWEKSLDNVENIKKYLNPTMMDQEQRLASVNNVSVARILLQVPLIQTEILSTLLRRMNEEVLVGDSLEDVPWACVLLSQLRFLEIVADADALTSRLEELLETSPDWFQRELIAYLPDIVTDSHHQSIADMLCKLMDTDSGLKQVILSCITGLTLGKECLEELRNKVLLIMQETIDISEIPSMVKFCLYECPSVEVCQKVLRSVTELDLHPDDNANLEECWTSQMMTVHALKMAIIMTKSVSKAALNIVSESREKPKVLDLIMILLLCRDSLKKKPAEIVFRKHVKSGYYRASLLNSFYRDFEQVAKDFQPTSLGLASNLLKSEDQTLVNFAIEWFRCQFLSHSKFYHLQNEIINKLILLMGNNDHTAKHALSVLCKMTETADEKEQLQRHCNELTVLMEKIDKFDLEEVATMNDLLHALCNNSNSSSEALRDDLFILLQKQLSNTDALIKCKGVVGGVMAIKHLAKNEDSCNLAKEILAKLEISTRDCPRAQALFYDKMCQVIAHDTNINFQFVEQLTHSFEDELANTYMIEMESYRGDLTPSFGLNTPDAALEMFVHFGETKYGAIVPSLFRMVRIGYMHIKNQDLEDLSAVLGCGIMMPKDLIMPEPRTLDLVFYCVNWYRELISAYITQRDPTMKRQVVQRLDNLMNLQGDLSNLLSLATDIRYQPPPCYFHKYPPPAFNRVEKKVGKKSGKKKDDKTNTTTTGGLPEWAAWENGSLMTIKNPMYFRRLDASIVHFLDTEISRELSSGHVCFIVKELSSMLDDDSLTNHIFIKDLIVLLPKICAKLNHLVSELRSDDDSQHKQAVRLIICLLAKIFNWKGFDSAAHMKLLRDGLRILAIQNNEDNRTLKHSKELVAEGYSYFESLADVATQIPVAHALVTMCKTLMKHSDTFTSEHKDRQAKMAYAFLCLEWPDDKHLGSDYKAAVTGLLKNWMDHETNPLNSVSETLVWLPEEVQKMERSQDKVGRLPTINRGNFHYLFQKLLDGLLRGAKISLDAANGDTAKLQVWRAVGKNLQLLVKVCKTISTRGTLLSYLRHVPHLLKYLLKDGMPILEHNLRYQPEEVTGILKLMQVGTRHLNVVCCHSTEKKDMALTKLIPAAKTIVEQLVYSVKGMLVLNNSSTAFWMGNLVNKDLDGQEILSQNSTSTEAPTIPDVSDNNYSSGDESLSDILGEDDDDDTNDTKDGSITS